MLSAKEFIAWQAFDEIEPIGGVRLDYLFASVCSTLVNLRRDIEKHPKPFPVSDFLLKWGEKKAGQPAEPPRKTWQQLKLIGQVLAASYNMMEEADREKRERLRRKREKNRG